MVKMFGSLASALYEFGADPETSEIERSKFEDTVVNSLKLFSQTEANHLFSHLICANPLDAGVGGVATCKDFNISEEEWQLVVKSKRQDGGSQQPFQSGPSGSSLGNFHRPIHLASVRSSSKSNNKQATKKESSIAGANTTSTSVGSRSRRTGSHSLGTSTKTTLQQSWTPSSLAGGGPSITASELFARGRPTEQALLLNAGKASLLVPTRAVQLGDPSRPRWVKGDPIGKFPADHPTRRSEMEVFKCVKQVDEWWPYASPRAPQRLQIPLKRSPR